MQTVIRYKRSKSKFFDLVEKLSNNFYDFSIVDDNYEIRISIKELFEKWDYFNSIFWKIVDWNHSSLGYDGFNLQSHSDKTRLFYALQRAHNKWMCISSDYLKEIAPVYFDASKEHEIKSRYFNDKEIDQILDLMLYLRNREKCKEYADGKG